jgi:hypothetical protein
MFFISDALAATSDTTPGPEAMIFPIVLIFFIYRFFSKRIRDELDRSDKKDRANKQKNNFRDDLPILDINEQGNLYKEKSVDYINKGSRVYAKNFNFQEKPFYEKPLLWFILLSFFAIGIFSGIEYDGNIKEEVSVKSVNKNLNDTYNKKISDAIWVKWFWEYGGGNTGMTVHELKSEIVKIGTVPAQAIIPSEAHRIPAYLVCYDFVAGFTGMASDGRVTDICVFAIENEDRHTYSLLTNIGRKDISSFESTMTTILGFVEH